MLKKSLLIVLLLTWVTLSAAEYVIVKAGKAHARIQCDPEPTAKEFRAVTELQDAVKKITGVMIGRNTMPGPVYRVFRNEGLDKVEIMCITLEKGKRLLPEKVIKKLQAAEDRDAFYIASENCPKNGKHIYIAGKNPSGVLYGTYAFIEDYLGVRFFHAAEDGSCYPSTKTLAVKKEIDDFRSSWLSLRRMSCWAGSVKPVPMQKMEEWLTRRAYHWNINQNYMNLSRAVLDHAATGNTCLGGGGHLTFELAVPQALFKTHPEYFPLQKGKRVCRSRSQRCLTNPVVRQKVLDYIIRNVSYNAKFSISYHDSTDGWCECEKCKQYGTDKNGKFSLSNYAHRFSKEMAEAVYKKVPEAQLEFSSYSDYRDLPTIPMKFDKRLLNEFCPHQRCYVHPFGDGSECNKPLRDLFLAWKKLTPTMGIFDYYAYSESPYCPLEYTLAKDMQFYKKHGLKVFIEDCTNKNLPIPDSNWQFYYLLSKLMWNADLDVEKEMEDAYSRYYGKAASPMKKYHAYRRELWESIAGHAMYGGSKRYAYCLLVAGAEKRLLHYLAEAEKLAGKDKMLKSRIARDRKYLTTYWIAEAAKIRKTEAGVKTLRLVQADCPIKIDGIGNEGAWRKAELITSFLNYETKGEPKEATTVKILYDKENLYIYYECMSEHAWGKYKVEAKERDGKVWGDDGMESFVMPPGGDYHHFIFNTIGTLYDAKVRNTSFDYKGKLAVKVHKDRYTAELMIPLKSLGVKSVRSGEIWKFHFYRNCRNLQPPKNSEEYGLDGNPPHETTLFRKATAGVKAVHNSDFSVTQKKKNGTLFVKYWSNYSATLEKGKNGNYIRLRDMINAYLVYPQVDTPTKINGSVTVSGKGVLTVSLSGCLNKKGDKRPRFRHAIQREVGKFTLTETPQSFPISFEVEPRSQYFIYFRVRGGEAKITDITLTR